MIFYLNSVPGGGGPDSNFKPLFDNGTWSLDDFTINPSPTAPYDYEINADGYIVSLSANDYDRKSGFVIVPNDTTKKYGFVFVLNPNSTNGRAQYGRCQRNADAYLCQLTGQGRISYHDIQSQSGVGLYAESTNANEGEFIAFGKDILIMGIYYYPLG